MVAAPVLRSVGQHLHPVGLLTIANMFNDPECSCDAPLSFYQEAGATFVQTNSDYKYGSTCGVFTVNTIGTPGQIYQTINPVLAQQSYTFSLWLKITTAMSVGLSAVITYFASDSTVIGNDGGLLVSGAVTAGWVRASQMVTTPPGTTSMAVGVSSSANPTALDSCKMDAFQLEPNPAAGPFVHGSMSGYCWAGSKYSSYSLQSRFPSALRAFQVGALAGAPSGMTAHATMTRPNVLPLQS